MAGRTQRALATYIITLAAIGMAATQAPLQSKKILIKAGRLIDVRAAGVLTNQGVLVDGERIQEVGPLGEIQAKAIGAQVLDLSNSTVLPGMIDCHTHLLLQGDITADDYDAQLLKESIPFRTIRATVAARTGLMNGFTAMRDLETEGAMYADVDVKRAINLGYIEGPRLYVATRALSGTGMYPLAGYSWELKVPEGVQIVDGPDNIRRAVREQVKYGADWIKYYSDRRYYVKEGALHSWVNFTDEEVRALVEEAHRLGRKVAAHAIGRDGIESALKAGVDTIEHGFGLDETMMDLMIARGVYWCPTIFVGVYVSEGRPPIWKTMVEMEAKAFSRAVKKGLKIAYGTDAGGYAWTENQAKELGYMVRYGMTPMQAIQSATLVAAELLDASTDIGVIERGRYADIIAVRDNPVDDVTRLEHVGFVMKGGRVVKSQMQ